MTKHSARAFVLVALGTLLLAPQTSFAAANPLRSHSTSVSALVLSAADVKAAYGSGFKTTMSEVISNKIAGASNSSLGPGVKPLIAGRITGYLVGFTRNVTSIHGGKVTVGHGVVFVISGVNAFKTPAYAQQSSAYDLSRRPRP
jgi:hypothetical protein